TGATEARDHRPVHRPDEPCPIGIGIGPRLHRAGGGIGRVRVNREQEGQETQQVETRLLRHRASPPSPPGPAELASNRAEAPATLVPSKRHAGARIPTAYRENRSRKGGTRCAGTPLRRARM